MGQSVLLVMVTLVVLGIAYGILGAALYARKRRHDAGFTCASVASKDGPVHGCVCRDGEPVCAGTEMRADDNRASCTKGNT